FRNFEDDGTPLARPRTLLIDSEQLDSGEALDPAFLEAAKDEVDRFRREVVERTGNLQDGERLSPESLLREVMNTVGKEDRLGSGIRCVVSVSMLTEGWDANTVTHVIGVRAFGTQLLCEQVIGRALRRQSYDLNEEGLFNVEYADVLGIPFDFTAKPVVVPPPKVRDVVHVHAIRPDRDPLEIEFPRVEGYRVELPRERLRAAFRPEHGMRLTPEMVGPTVTQNQGIVGAPVDLNLAHLERERLASVAFRLTHHLLNTRWRDPNEEPKLYLFGQMKAIVTRWLETCLECVGGTYPAQLYYLSLAEQACNRINAAIVTEFEGTQPVHAILDPYNPVGSTRFVNFTTSKTNRWETTMSHVNWAILDSDWEGEFCRVADSHPRVRAWVKNQNLGLEVPYLMNGETHTYLPDFIVQVDDGRPDPLNLIVEVKGYRGEDAVVKAMTMNTYWVPGVNNLKTYGRWAFVELTDVWTMQHDLAQKIEGRLRASFEKALDRYTPREGTPA
ncbi:MAG TPA: hypothetical protein VHN99_04045, partial [Deinococcales bacterium]|nr:hypothetical protein [Deinococcales bacterium]